MVIGLLQADITIDSAQQEIEHFELEYFYDHNKNHTIESIQNVEFNATTSNMFTFGFITGNSWFKLTINNQSSTKDFVFELLEPYFNGYTFIRCVKEGGIKRRQVSTTTNKTTTPNTSPPFLLLR